MFIELFYKLRKDGLPVSITEYLSLLEALEKQVANIDIDAFYYLVRAALVKDECLFDHFDQLFAVHFEGMEAIFNAMITESPAAWLQGADTLNLSEEEKQQIKALGGWEKLMQTLKERLQEQNEAHHGGNKWIGMAGTSPFGAYGYNPEGIRIAQHESRHHRATKVWNKREFRNLDDSVELGKRNIKIALRKLRNLARKGASDEVDIDNTISATAKNAGLLDVRMAPERHNAIKVLLFLDVGGPWTGIYGFVKNYSPPAKPNSNTLSIFTSITVCMKASEKIIIADTTIISQPWK